MLAADEMRAKSLAVGMPLLNHARSVQGQAASAQGGPGFSPPSRASADAGAGSAATGGAGPQGGAQAAGGSDGGAKAAATDVRSGRLYAKFAHLMKKKPA